MKVPNALSYSFLLFICSLFACASEVETFDPNLLYGHWDISSAERNGQTTETLTNTFFEFNNEGKMVTNFNLDGNEVTGDFEIVGLNITQKGAGETNYSVEKIEGEKLVLITKLMNHDFKLNLKKKN